MVPSVPEQHFEYLTRFYSVLCESFERYLPELRTERDTHIHS